MAAAYNWSDKRNIEEMTDYMYRHYFAEDPDKGELRMKAYAWLRGICDADGMVNDSVNTKVAWIYWETEERQ